MKAYLRNVLRAVLGKQPPTTRTDAEDLLFQVDPDFQARYRAGLAATGTQPSSRTLVDKRQARFYNLLGLLELANGLDGQITELGCWRGLSSFLLNSQLKKWDPRYDGNGYWIFDSFEGLSKASAEDKKLEDFVPDSIEPAGGMSEGAYAASEDLVRRNLADFPRIRYVKGWLPGSLSAVPPGLTWRFVHIDLDLHDPIKGSFEFFAERMVDGGVIVFDDYGSLYWPGARKAVDAVAQALGTRVVVLSTGQAFWIKRSSRIPAET